jgi:acyl-coenzyme A synthetase/AMP-(fatty) acid ligase
MVSAGEPLNPEVNPTFEQGVRAARSTTVRQTENTLLVGTFPGAEIRPGSMGKPSPG